ncbi:hypothetical protein GWI33_011996 [Rhynchophorus ferrugineus]|uniref:Uncharacterized protein n=1 Tax=Rhynchophorus ferrugineus TaxID=354439 RepID=A0A834IWI7_RHYFE|nr:hypothetical protein GWI33_011996 [Rhynchophorus ferrugineus]
MDTTAQRANPNRDGSDFQSSVITMAAIGPDAFFVRSRSHRAEKVRDGVKKGTASTGVWRRRGWWWPDWLCTTLNPLARANGLSILILENNEEAGELWR